MTDDTYVSNLLFIKNQVIIAEDEEDTTYMPRYLQYTYNKRG